MQPYYTKIIHALRDSLGLTNNEYIVIDTINRLTKNDDQWCKKSRADIGKIAGISKRSTIKIINKYSDDIMDECQLLTKNSTGKVRSTDLWDSMYKAITVGQELPQKDQEAANKIKEFNSPNGEESSPKTVKKVHRSEGGTGEESSPEAVKKVHRNGEESSPPSIYKHKYKERTLFRLEPGEESSPGTSQEKKADKEDMSTEELFEYFWKYYPGRGPNARNPKQRSKKYFTRLIEKENEDPEKIIKGAIVFRDAMSGREGEERRGIPMSSTWLNDKEYLDWWEEYDRRSVSKKQKAIEAGGLTREEAEQYAERKFREPLENILGQFQILEFEDETIYLPQ